MNTQAYVSFDTFFRNYVDRLAMWLPDYVVLCAVPKQVVCQIST